MSAREPIILQIMPEATKREFAIYEGLEPSDAGVSDKFALRVRGYALYRELLETGERTGVQALVNGNHGELVFVEKIAQLGGMPVGFVELFTVDDIGEYPGALVPEDDAAAMWGLS